MNSRLCLRLLQPVRTVPFVAIYAAFAALVAHKLFGLAWPDARLATIAVTLPLLLGAAVTAVAHALLHRPFALLLPNFLPRVRRAAALGYVALAATVTLAGVLIEPAAPAPALFGLALALLTLASANRRQGFRRLGLVGAMPGFLTVAAGWIYFHLQLASRLLAALQALPGVFLLAGTGLAVTTFTLGFSRRALRSRALTPYFTALNAPITVNRSVFRRQIQERVQSDAARHLRATQRPGRDWPLRSVGPRLRDWLRVLDHQRANAFVRMQGWTLAMTAFCVALLLGSFSVMTAIEQHRPFQLTDMAVVLANLTAETTTRPEHFPAALTTLAVILPALTVLLARLGFSRPLLAYPLARTRLAQVVFAHTARHLLGGLLLPSAALWLCSLLGQTATGRIHPLLGLPGAAMVGLTLAPVLPLLALKGYADQTAHTLGYRALGYLVSIGAALLVTVGQRDWRGFILTPAGLLASALATALTLWLLRSRIQRHYLSCDLTRESAWPISLGAS